MINFWSFSTIQEFLKVSPIYFLRLARHTLINYSWGMQSGVITVYILKVNTCTCAKRLYTIIALASPSVGRSFDSRTGGRGFDSRGRTNNQVLKITAKRRYSGCAASG